MPSGSGVSSLPFGPWTFTVLPSMLTVTPFGIAIGFFPIRDISLDSQPLTSRDEACLVLAHTGDAASRVSPYQISHNNSPPRPCLRAWRPVMTPFGVVRMLIPSPPSTRGISVRRTYTRQPGRDTRARFEITASLLLPYFK